MKRLIKRDMGLKLLSIRKEPSTKKSGEHILFPNWIEIKKSDKVSFGYSWDYEKGLGTITFYVNDNTEPYEMVHYIFLEDSYQISLDIEKIFKEARGGKMNDSISFGEKICIMPWSEYAYSGVPQRVVEGQILKFKDKVIEQREKELGV